jgi:tripartite-type tricarboxylate transporter receptor subunit TctC
VPTIAESGLPGFEASQVFGLVAPTGITPALVTQINTAVTAIVRDPAMVKFLGDQGAEPRSGSAADYNAFLRDEVSKWAKVVKDSGAKVD